MPRRFTGRAKNWPPSIPDEEFASRAEAVINRVEVLVETLITFHRTS